MKIKVNLQGNFPIVQEGERILEITDAKVVPSGKPEKLTLNMKDIEDGASLMSSYTLANEKSVWAMSMMLNVALDMADGDEFDVKDVGKLIGVKLLCEVAHSEYNEKTYANVRKVISRVDSETGEVGNTPDTGTRSDLNTFLD